jgi:hypothetical protein
VVAWPQDYDRYRAYRRVRPGRSPRRECRRRSHGRPRSGPAPLVLSPPRDGPGAVDACAALRIFVAASRWRASSSTCCCRRVAKGARLRPAGPANQRLTRGAVPASSRRENAFSRYRSSTRLVPPRKARSCARPTGCASCAPYFAVASASDSEIAAHDASHGG